MDGLEEVERQRERIDRNRARADRVLARKRARTRSLPPVVVGLSALAVTGAATAWVDHHLPAPVPAPTRAVPPAASVQSAELAAEARALQAVAKSLAADAKEITSLRTSSVPGAGGTAAGSGTGGAALPNLPSISIPAAPAVQAVTGASGVPVP